MKQSPYHQQKTLLSVGNNEHDLVSNMSRMICGTKLFGHLRHGPDDTVSLLYLQIPGYRAGRAETENGWGGNDWGDDAICGCQILMLTEVNTCIRGIRRVRLVYQYGSGPANMPDHGTLDGMNPYAQAYPTLKLAILYDGGWSWPLRITGGLICCVSLLSTTWRPVCAYGQRPDFQSGEMAHYTSLLSKRLNTIPNSRI